LSLTATSTRKRPRSYWTSSNGVCKVKTGYFRTKPKDGKLVGSICTDDPDRLHKQMEAESRLKWIETNVLSPLLFEVHSAGKQESLTPQSDEKTELEKILDSPISIKFENIHLSEITKIPERFV